MESAAPRYVQIEQALRADIADLRPGDRLPSEAKLCQRFGVSRMTARGAVQRLEEQGLVYRVRGAGTFVADAPIHRQAGNLLSFSDEMRQRGLRPSSQLLEISQRHPDADEQAALRLDSEARVVVVRRLRLADGNPMALERVVMHPSCAAVLAAELEAGSLHDALRELGRDPSLARGTLLPQLTTTEDAKLLGVPPHAPMLVERRTVFDQHEEPIEHTETRYSPTRYVFDIELRDARR
jgi:GntR family transcriptional regulator